MILLSRHGFAPLSISQGKRCAGPLSGPPAEPFERLPSPEKLTQAFYKVLTAQIHTVRELAITEHTCARTGVCVHVRTSLVP